MKPKINTRSLIDTKKAVRSMENGRDKALDRAGSITRRSAQKQFRRRQPLKRPVWNKVGDHQGFPLVSMSFTESTPGKVTTWKPKEFLRRKIFYAKDKRAGSVVIGPDERFAKVQQLQEFGGRDPVVMRLVSPIPVANLFQYKVPKHLMAPPSDGATFGPGLTGERAYIGMWHSFRSRAKGEVVARSGGKVPGAGFMGKGFEKVRPKIPQMFKNAMRGP